VLIPAFNCAGTIAQTVESCLAQRDAALEVIVVNDGSTDGTAQVLERFGDRIRVITQPNAGLAGARNRAIQAATGEYLAWLDADDLAFPDRMRLQASVLDRHPEVVLVSSDFSAFRDDAHDFADSHIDAYYSAVKRVGGIEAAYPRKELLPASVIAQALRVRFGEVYERLLHGNFVHPPTVMVRRDAFARAGLLDRDLRVGCDYDMFIRLARLGPFAYIDAPLLRYRVSDAQMSQRSRIATPLDTMRTLEKVRRDDPQAFARERALFRHRTAWCLVEAAYWMGPACRADALALLVRALAHGPSASRWLHALGRILVPRSVVNAVRRGR
jgi:glycosyltransferase involved in cell wall biosynthesis